jgi:hypothetical protein
MRQTALEQRKKITLLEDGNFTAGAWGWQFTTGASVAGAAGRSGGGAVRVETKSGDYARFLVLGPTVGATYTLSGWVKTEGIVATEPNTGAYFAASQFEFQGRPTEFTVDGKQAVEARYGNYAGTAGWQRFTQSIQCLPTTAWFEVVVGVYRASGEAWFGGLTFVEGTEGAEIAETILPREANAFTHQRVVLDAGRLKPRAAVLNEPSLPIRGFASSPERIAELLTPTHDVVMLSATQIANTNQLNRKHFDLLVLAYGETFPLPAREAMLAFLADGGDLLTMGGYAFQSPVVEDAGQWRFTDELLLQEEGAKNLLPPFSQWKMSDQACCSADEVTAKVIVPKHMWAQTKDFYFDLPAEGEGKQFFFAADWRVQDVHSAPEGSALIGVEQLDKMGEPAYAARLAFAKPMGTSAWTTVSQLLYLVPDCVTLRIRISLQNATGTVEARNIRLESRPPQVRINTALGWPEDSLTVKREQLGLFDADYRLKRVAGITTVSPDGTPAVTSELQASGYAASGVVGMNYARWIPLLEAVDAKGRKRGSAGAIMHHSCGPYARSSWAYFGIDTLDLFAADLPAAQAAFASAAKKLALKYYLHGAETDLAAYRTGEPVRIRVLLSNYSLHAASMHVRVAVKEQDKARYQNMREVELQAGGTMVIEDIWATPDFDADHYTVQIDLLREEQIVDSIVTAFNVWKIQTLAQGMDFAFHENYFQVDGKSLFLQGTDDYLHTFIDQDENPGTWLADAQGCRDSGIDVYENLMGLRGPQQRPTEAWWRWVDAMLLNTQRVGGIFFPGLLVFSNTAVGNLDLADQKAYVKAFAARYKDAAGIMYYLNGDLELHDPNLSDLQKLYNEFLEAKYGNDKSLRAAWTVSPPDAALGKLTIRHGSSNWNDIRTMDDFQFRSALVRRWLNAMHDSIREVDTVHPVTAEFYQSPVSGIDLLTALGKLELANFGYFNEKGEDYYRFPQTCRFLDQSMRGKGINVGEFGVKTHPAWDATGYYIEARAEAEEQSYFLALAHYGFALGASKVQNWCWKYPADLPFEWGINYPNEMVPRDVRAFYRNSGILLRSLRPRYEASETVVLLASDNRMGGQGHRIVEGQLNAIRLLMDENVRFGTLTDEFLDVLPGTVKTIFYPLPYCPSDAIVEQLENFVRKGGKLYVSGDISYDSLRKRTRTDRLCELCGAKFVSERYPNIEYEKSFVVTKPNGPWPLYDASPSMVMRAESARVLLADTDGNPVIVENRYGEGTVVFSADPIELHGDPRYQPYAHAFYHALINALNVSAVKLQAEPGQIHYFQVPSQDAREIHMLVNHGASTQEMKVSTGSGEVSLSLASRLPGIVVAQSGMGVVAVESSGDVVLEDQSLLSTNLHIMAISLDQKAIASSARILLLPMGTGTFTLHTVHAFVEPVLLLGEIVHGRWTKYGDVPLSSSASGVSVEVNADISLSMLVLCDEADRLESEKTMEMWMNTPWRSGGQQ